MAARDPSTDRRDLRRVLLALTMIVCAWALLRGTRGPLVDVATAADADPPVLLVAGHDGVGAAGSEAHLWVMIRKPKDDFLLLHRSSKTPDNTLYRVFQSNGQPIAMAVYANDLYVVFSDMTMQAIEPVSSPRMGPSPVEVSQLKPLPRDATLVDLTADTLGPIALLRDAPDANADADTPSRLRLVALRRNTWQTLTLPDDLPANAKVTRLVRFDERAEDEAIGVLISGDTTVDSGATLYQQTADGWVTRTYPLELHDNADAVTGINNLFIVQRDADDRSRLSVTALRPGDASPLRSIAALEPADNWRATWYDGRIATIIARVNGDMDWTRHDAQLTGDEPLAPTPLEIDRPAPLQYSPLIVIVGVLLGMFFLLAGATRSFQAGTPELPKHTERGGMQRLLGDAVDFVIPLGVAMAIFDISDPLDVYRRWVANPSDWTDVMPGLTTIGLMVAHTTLIELVFATSIGKAMFRCRVVTYEGKRPRAWQVLVRNAFKAFELIPPFLLLVMPLLNDYQQRLGDIVARTVVIHRQPGAPRDEEDDDEDENDDSADGADRFNDTPPTER